MLSFCDFPAEHWIHTRTTLRAGADEESGPSAPAVRNAHARFSPWAAVEQVDADSCQLLLSTDSLVWLAMFGALQAGFRVVRPPELLDHLESCAALFSQMVAATRTGEGFHG